MSEIHSSDATPPPSPIRADDKDTTEVGRRIGPYKLLQRLGEGGMGEVWLAEQSQPVRRQVAIKLIRPGLSSRHVLARFEAERQALAMMDHPNIAKVLEAGEMESEGGRGRPYFVMELVKGIPITKYCDQEKLSLKERLQLFIPVCQAVQHAHQKGIIHRDLKPSNVLIGLYDGRPVPKVIDFGVAKAAGQPLTEQTLFTEVGSIIGTPEYMAPEQAELNNLDIDTRADVYSLGVVMYELLTGSLPFSRKELAGAAFAEMLRLIREVEPPKPSTRLSGSDTLASVAAVRKLEPKRLTNIVRGELDWIVMKCLEKERARRYESANGLAQDIERYLAEEPVQAGPPSAGYRMRKFARRHQGPVLAASLLVLALLAGVLGTAWAWQKAVVERNQKEQARIQATTEKNAAIAVLNFLQDDLLKQASAFERAKDGGAAKLNPTVMDLLDRAATELTVDKIDKKFPNQPLVQAQILRTVGKTYRDVGDFDKAVKHLARACEIETKELGAEQVALGGALMSLGRAYNEAGNPNEAIRLFQQIRDISTKVRGPRHATTLAAMTNLATVYLENDRRKEALDILITVRDAQVAELGADHEDTLTTLHNMASIYSQDGQDNEAIRLNEQLRDARIRALGPFHPDTLATIMNLGTSYQNSGRVDDAVKTLESIVKPLEEKMGPDHPFTLHNYISLASAYSASNRDQDAVPVLQKAIALSTTKLGPNHRMTLKAKQELGSTFQTLGKIDETIKIFEQVRDAQISTLGAEHTETITTLYSLGLAYHEAGRVNEAIAVMESSTNASLKKHGKNDHVTITAQQSLALVYEDAGRLDDAVKMLEQVRDATLASVGFEHAHSLSRLTLLAGMYVKSGRFTDAEPLLRDIIRVFEQKKMDKWSGFYVRSLLGASLAGQKKYAEAEPLLIQGYERIKLDRKEIVPKYRPLYVIGAVDRIVKLYEQWEKPAEAAKWREERTKMEEELKTLKP